MNNMPHSQPPLILNKDLGAAVPTPLAPATPRNADGEPVIALTQEQKYVFDKQGWLLIPGVLAEDEIEEMKEFVVRLHREPQSLPEHHRSPLAGPTQKLADHPRVLGFLEEFVYTPYTDQRGVPQANEHCYGFRIEMSAYRYREADSEARIFNPHNGNGMMRLPGDGHTYHCIPGRAQAGLVRVWWELAPVERGRGGTLFITGSHKACFQAPESAWSPDSPLWDTYECPAGSLMFFTEAITHSATRWLSSWPRVAVLNSYNTIGSRWHDWDPDPRLVEEMPALRQTLFRPVHVNNNSVLPD